jgi:hypothetical protein
MTPTLGARGTTAHRPNRVTVAWQDARMETFHEGQRVWVEQEDGTQRAAIFVGEAEQSTWFGGVSGVYVVYPDTRSGEEVEAVRVIAREE